MGTRKENRQAPTIDTDAKLLEEPVLFPASLLGPPTYTLQNFEATYHPYKTNQISLHAALDAHAALWTNRL